MEELNLRDLDDTNTLEVNVQQPQQVARALPGKKRKQVGLWEKLFNKKKIEKEDKVAVIYLKNNRMAIPMELKPKNGFFTIEGRTYHEERDCVYSLGKERIPFVIIPEWSLVPIGTKEQEDKEMLVKFAEFQDHTLKAIRHAELVKVSGEEGKKLNPKVVIGILILAVVGFAILQNYSG